MGEAKRRRVSALDHETFGLNPEFYSAVGLAVLQWGRLENLLMLGIVRRKGIELGQGLGLAANLPFGGLLSLWKIEAATATDGERLKPLMARIEAAYARRVALSQGTWKDSPDAGEVIRVHLRADGAKIAELHEKVRISSVVVLVGEIEAIRKELNEIMLSVEEQAA